MAAKVYPYEPDYAVSPGEILEERLEVWEMSQAEFARRCGRSPKLISQIIAGVAPVEPETALQFEKVSGLDARIWLGLEAGYRLHLERAAEQQRLAEAVEWAKGFPRNELTKRGYLKRTPPPENSVADLLSFFGVASVEAWQNRQAALQVAYRHSPTFSSDDAALSTWLRLGELAAEQVECADYSEAKFKQALRRIRNLTTHPFDVSSEEARRLCQDAGVVLAIIKPLPKTALSGVARWLTPRKALIQLSARHLSEDHLWFSFFHEAAHILIHGKRDIFVHDNPGKVTDADIEADSWARDFLVAKDEWDGFVRNSFFNRDNVQRFAGEQRIAPGIVVGRLQHEQKIPWSRLNDLKVRLRWKEAMDK